MVAHHTYSAVVLCCAAHVRGYLRSTRIITYDCNLWSNHKNFTLLIGIIGNDSFSFQSDQILCYLLETVHFVGACEEVYVL